MWMKLKVNLLSTVIMNEELSIALVTLVHEGRVTDTQTATIVADFLTQIK